jgi:hypothetical protein
MPPGWTAASAEEILEDRAAQYPYIKVHTGDPGAAGTLNAAVETDRVLATWGPAAAAVDGRSWEIAWTVDLEWLGVAATEPYTHVSGWSTAGPSGGVCGWTGQLTADPVVVGNDFRIPAGAYKLRQPIAYNP